VLSAGTLRPPGVAVRAATLGWRGISGEYGGLVRHTMCLYDICSVVCRQVYGASFRVEGRRRGAVDMGGGCEGRRFRR